jgi:hypothetical protein
MHREKFPEKVPFRLTRMLTNAMEVSGIEGNFRCTCERVMTVLRDNRDSLIAMLEAFVHDPLISWRLLGVGASGADGGTGGKGPPQAQAQAQEQEQAREQAQAPTRTLQKPQQHAQHGLEQEQKDGAAAVEDEALLSPQGVQPLPSPQQGEQQQQQQKEEEEEEQQQQQQQQVPPPGTARVPSPAVSGGPSFGPDAPAAGGATTARMRVANHERFAALPTVSEAVGSGGGAGEGAEEDEEAEEQEQKERADRKAGDGGESAGEEARGSTDEGAAAAATSATALLGAAGSLGAATSAATSAAARRARLADLHLEIGSLAASISANKTRFSSSVALPSRSLAQSRLDHRSVRERELVHALGPEGLEAPAEVLNEKAIAVIRRVQDKLTGLDFENDEALDVEEQVERLILQATSKENLCQLFTGWCSFW